MGTRCVVELWSTDRSRGQAAIDAVFTEFRRIDALMSTYKPESELSRVNATAATAPVRVSRELYDLLATSIEYSSSLAARSTSPTRAWATCTTIARACIPTPRLSRPLYRASTTATSSWTRKRIPCVSGSRVRIDLGGIAKGHAVDRGIAVLQALGIDRAMVNAGGDTRIIGDRLGRPWVVGIRHPDDEHKVVLRIPLTDTAMSTSGDYERYFEEDGVRYPTSWIPGPGGRRRSSDR